MKATSYLIVVNKVDSRKILQKFVFMKNPQKIQLII